MTEDDLRKHGYYLFGIDQDRFVQVRDVESDKVLLMTGYGPHRALAEAAEMLKKHPQLSKYRKRPAVLKPVTVTVTASSDRPYYLATGLRQIAKLIDQGKTSGMAVSRKGTYDWKITEGEEG